MFVNMSDVSIGLHGLGPGSMGLLAPCILDSSQPVILSSTLEVSSTGLVLSNTAHVADFFAMVESINKPVWIRIALAPAASRTSVAGAVANGQAQMTYLVSQFLGYNIPHLLGGFALNNVIYGTKYEDDSIWTRSDVNTLILHGHGLNKPVAVFSDPAIDSLSRFAPEEPRYPEDSVANTLASSSLGANASFVDWLIHVNPIYPWHLYDPNYPELIMDMGRLSSTMTAIRMKTTSTLKHAVVQAFPHNPGMDTVNAPYDGAIGATFDTQTLTKMTRMATFFAYLGIHDYCFTLDTAYGAHTNTFVNPNMYRLPGEMIGEYKRANVSGVTVETDGGVINVFYDGVLSAAFDEEFQLLYAV